LSFLWTPGILSIENRVAIEFYHQGIDSGHSNSLAFAYAYVLAGLPGSLVGGFILMAVLGLAVRIVAATRQPFVIVAFNAYLCYVFLDMLNSNFLQYAVKVLAVSLLIWIAVDLWRIVRGRPARSMPKAAARPKPAG
jgi:hypothetical protein